MVIYWLYKYKVEDRDLGIVEYVSWKETENLEFPVASLCFQNPFKKSTQINETAYLQYLKGDIAGNGLENIEYHNVTLDISDYFIISLETWFNESNFRNTSVSFDHVNTFNGYNRNTLIKCFSVQIKSENYHHIKRILFVYNLQKLFNDWSFYKGPKTTCTCGLHYPGQLLLGDGLFPMRLNQPIMFFVKEIEFIRRRSRYKKQCFDGNNPYDTRVFEQHISKVGCRPPYLRTETSAPLCQAMKTMKESKFEYTVIKYLDYLEDCQILSKIRKEMYGGTRASYMWRNSKKVKLNSTLNLEIEFPDKITVITMSKEVDIHTLIGNIGGYIGLFLGNKKSYIRNI